MKWTTNIESNAYFNGGDVRVYVEEPDGQIVVNEYEGCWAINVKERSGIPTDIDADSLTDDEIREAENMARDGWWADADVLAEEFGFGGVGSAGRSGGWCCVDGTEHWEPGWLTEFDDFDFEDDEQREEVRKKVERFIELGLKLHREVIPFWRGQFHSYLRERLADKKRGADLAERQTCIEATITWNDNAPDLKIAFLERVIAEGFQRNGFNVEPDMIEVEVS